MSEIRFRNSPLKGLKFFFYFAVIIVLVIWQRTDTSGFMFWYYVCFLSLGIPVCIFYIFDRRVKIIINSAGIWDKSTRQEMVKWEQIKNVSVVKVYFSYILPLEVDDTFVFSGRLYPWGGRPNRSGGGGRVNIDLGKINCDPYKLAAFMEEMTKAAPDQRDALIDNYRKELKMK